jgi:Ca2+-binding EF-hand superfamily protein
MFKKFDGDSDGRLTKFDLVKLFRALTQIIGVTHIGESDLNELFACLDDNGDKKITILEFNKLMEGFK